MARDFPDVDSSTEFVELYDNTVVKKVLPRFFEIELAMTRWARKLGEACGFFQVPDIITYDESTASLVLGRLQGITSLWDFLSRNPYRTDVLRQTGKALAGVHSALELPRGLESLPALDGQCAESDLVPLHGDFSARNVMWKEEDRVLVILDWAGLNWWGVPRVVGPRYVDLAVFVCSLGRLLPRGKALRLFRRRTQAFLEGYRGQLGMNVHHTLLRDYALRVTRGSLRKWAQLFWHSGSPEAGYRAMRYMLWYGCLRVLTKQWTRCSVTWPSRRESVGDSGNGYDYRGRFTRSGTGLWWEAEYEKPGWHFMWGEEQAALDDICKRYYSGRPIQHLDFACGTGRILSRLSDRTELSVGLDNSEDMLQVARRKCPDAQLVRADITEQDVLGVKGFNLITAFRFFPNAQPLLRNDAMKCLVRHLSADGLLVFNNHVNSVSILWLVRRLSQCLGRRSAGAILPRGMSRRAVRRLVISAGLRIIDSFSIGVLPFSGRYMVFPASIHRLCDRVANACGMAEVFAQNVVYVCGKGHRPQGDQEEPGR